MKKLHLQLVFLFSLCFAFSSNAQSNLPPGTSAPDWTATDLDGVQHDMSDILDSGKHVVLEFSATWCGPCWNFHNTGTLETLYDTYGPNGTDQIRVFYIEADQTTNTACLYGPTGCNGSTQGDWVTGHDFPFIDLMPGNANTMDDAYGVTYFPTIYAVSANGNNGVYEVGQETNISNWASWFFESFEMELAPTVNDALCAGEGSIQMSAINGAGSIDYEWSNGSTGDYIDGLSAGSYTVTATDDNGYFLEETIVLSGPPEELAAELLDLDDVSCFNEGNGALIVDGTGGNGGYQFAWSNGETGSSIENLDVGNYTVTVTDVAGCTQTEVYIITQPEVLVLTNLPEDAACGADEGSVISFASGGTAPWSFDYGVGPNYTGTFDYIAPGDYIMTVTDYNGCVDQKPFTIEATEGPNAEAEAPNMIDCSTTEVSVLGAGSSEGDDIEYEWTTTDGSIESGADEINAVVGAAGTYKLAVTNTTTGCITEASVDVEANVDAPTTEIAPAEELDCITTTTTLDGSESSEGDDITYAWSTDDGNITSGATTTMANIDAAGTYTLLTTNTTNGCTSSESIEVTIDDALPAIAVSDVELDCAVTEAELCADVDATSTVTWTTPDGDIDATCITVTMAGDYIAKAVGTNGCEALATSTVTLSDDLPQVSIDQPDAITCTVTTTTIEADLEGDVSDFSISWMSPNGDIINSSDLSVDVDAPGMYTLTVQNIENGCTTVSSVTVDEIIINPESAFTSTLTDGVLNVESNSTGDPSTYSWSFGATGSNESVIFDETGTYEVCLTVVNDCGEDTHCEDVYFVSELKFEGEYADELCNGAGEGSIVVTPSGGEPGYTISWVGPNGFTSTDLAISGLIAGEYSMVLNDNYGYEKSESYIISEPTAIEQTLIEITDETNNDANGSITIEAMGGTGALTYDWSNGENTPVISGLTAGEYFVNVTDENGCTKEFGPFVVETTTSIGELDFVNSLSIYPIPANNYLNVMVSLNNAQPTQIRVIDAFGKLITTQNHTSKEINARIDVSELSTGIYYIEFGNDTGRSIEKFVVIK
jgi:PKD repeat protein